MNNNGGISFLGLLQVVFITLKLIGFIKWSWLWVLLPLWIYILVALIVEIYLHM